MKNFLSKIAIVFVALVLAFGILVIWYVIDTKNDCFVYGKANPNLEFHWSFSTACEFQLPDGTWFGVMEYEKQEKLEIDYDD